MTRVETIRPKRVDCHDSEARTSFMCTHELPCATRHVHGHMPLDEFSVIVSSCSMEAHKESDCCTVHRRKHQWNTHVFWKWTPWLHCKNLGEWFTTEVTYTGSGPLKSFTLYQEATLLVPLLQIPYQNLGPRSHSTHAWGWIAASSCTPKCLWLTYCLVAHTVFLRTNRSVYLKKSTPF